MGNLDKHVWQALSPLLDRALDLEPEDRAEMVAELKRSDPRLAANLERLLEQHAHMLGSNFLESGPIVEAGVVPSLKGETIGAYTLVEPLGMGGMGVVWRAHRSDGRYDARVAIKLLNLSLAGQEGLRRFNREGTLLARLEHPSIGRLLDAGVTPTGQPYLVLEYVEGTRIDVYADEAKLDPAARVRLFLQVADAVAHAHARLIVHRDIKPANILVTAAGQVKLLDFGIGKLLEDDDGDRASLTVDGIGALTPVSAAPEQARGEAVTTATDVYALGVLLHTLLTGIHATSSGCRTASEHLAALLDRDPVRPSAAAGQPIEGGDDVRSRAARRRSTPERLRRLYRGDLDTIVGKALEKRPGDRYGSVGAFADDLRRFLALEPISARRPRWTYRTRKFVRRHRIGVAAAAVVAVTIVAAAVVATLLMLEARRQRDDARFQAKRAEASSEFMRYLVTHIGTQPMTMKQILDRGRTVLEQQYGADQGFVARMLVQLSGPYQELGEYGTSAAMMQRALDIAERIGDLPLLLSTHCGAADDAVEQGDLAGARAHLEQVRRRASQSSASERGLGAGCAVAETRLATAEGRYADAIASGQGAVAILEAAGDTGNTRYTSTLSNLAYAYILASRFREALPVLEKTIAATARIGRERTIGMVTLRHNQGNSERALGWWIRAERTYAEAIDVARSLDESGRLPVYLMVGYGRVLVELNRVPEGAGLLRRVLDRPDATPRFVQVARLVLASAMLDAGDVAGARELAERDLEDVPDPNARPLVIMLRARIAAAAGRRDEARAHIAEGLRLEGYPGTVSPTAYRLLEYEARLALEDGDLETALRSGAAAVGACDQHFGTDEPSGHTGRARLTLGKALAAAGRRREARTELELAAAILERAGGANHPWAAEARAALQEP